MFVGQTFVDGYWVEHDGLYTRCYRSNTFNNAAFPDDVIVLLCYVQRVVSNDVSMDMTQLVKQQHRYYRKPNYIEIIEADSEDDQQERIIGISLFAYAQHTHVHARVCASQTHMINQK